MGSTCPACGERSGVPIFWGYPSPDSMDSLLKAVKRGEVELGGCLVTGDDPDTACAACGHRWHKGRARRRSEK